MIATDFDLKRLRANDHRLTSVLLNFSCNGILTENDQRNSDLGRSLQRNTHLDTVIISADDSFASPFADLTDYLGVLKDIGRLPTLKKLHISSRPKRRGVLLVRALIRLLQESKSLECLAVYDIELRGDQADFEELAQVVQGLWFLKRFTLEDIQVTCSRAAEKESPSGMPSAFPKLTTVTCSHDLSSSCPLDSLLLSLSILPSLKSLNLTASKDAPPQRISSSSIAALFLSASVTAINLKNWDLTSEHLTSIGQLLTSNSSLKDFTIGPLPDLSSVCASALASAFRENTTLAHLEMILTRMLSDACAVPLARALSSNKSLKSFVLSGKKLGRASKVCKEAFQEMVQSNFTLQRIVLFRKTFLQPALQLYTRLNRMGRQNLLLTNAPDTWMQALANPLVNNDLDAIFYFLSNNPVLCADATFAQFPTKRKAGNHSKTNACCNAVEGQQRSKRQRLQ